MPKDNEVTPGFDVQVIPVVAGANNGQISIPSASQIGNGVAVIPLPQFAQVAMPQQAQAGGPSVILIAMGGKKDEEEEERRRKEKEKEKAEKEAREKEKKTSRAYHRL